MADGSKASNRSPGEDWIAIVRKNGSSEFAAGFVERPILKASVLLAPCIGVEPIAAFFGESSRMYDTIVFTNETVDDNKTFLEWEGKVFGINVCGVTILTRDDAGLIQGIQLYHSPLHVIVGFSAELGKRLSGKVDSSLFGA